MDFEDLFHKDRRRNRHGYRDGDHDHGREHREGHENGEYHNDRHHFDKGMEWRDHDHGSHGRKGHEGSFDLSHTAYRMFMNNKTLLIVAGVALLAIVGLVGILMLPLLKQVLGYIDKQGLQGVFDRIWQGTGGAK
ncbi:MAG: hypothetical protein IH611_13550 [Deltaproteobacteria bacterium]|nr:hypothetical protein [Deltaproteobacteria bacterium]